MFRTALVISALLALPSPILAAEQHGAAAAATGTTPITSAPPATHSEMSHMHHMMMAHAEAMHYSPTIAAILSLQPMPADLGNFYAGNPRFAIGSTALQLGLMGAGMILAAENSSGWMHRAWYGSGSRDEWTSGERAALYGMLGGYVLTKVVSAWVAVDTVTEERKAREETAKMNAALLPLADPASGMGGVAVALRW